MPRVYFGAQERSLGGRERSLKESIFHLALTPADAILQDEEIRVEFSYPLLSYQPLAAFSARKGDRMTKISFELMVREEEGIRSEL